MKMNNFIEGLQLLQDYYDDPNGYHLGAEHDIIYVYATDKPLPESESKRLFALDWFQPDVEKDGETEGHGPYDPEEGWAVYV